MSDERVRWDGTLVFCRTIRWRLRFDTISWPHMDRSRNFFMIYSYADCLRRTRVVNFENPIINALNIGRTSFIQAEETGDQWRGSNYHSVSDRITMMSSKGLLDSLESLSVTSNLMVGNTRYVTEEETVVARMREATAKKLDVDVSFCIRTFNNQKNYLPRIFHHYYSLGSEISSSILKLYWEEYSVLDLNQQGQVSWIQASFIPQIKPWNEIWSVWWQNIIFLQWFFYLDWIPVIKIIGIRTI